MDSPIEINLETDEIVVDVPGGARGLKGEKGEQGEKGNTGERGPRGYSISGAEKEGTSEPGTTDTYTLKLDDDEQTPVGVFKVYNGINGVWTRDEEPPDNYDVWIVPDGKTDEIPTKTSDLENDSGFITNGVDDLMNYYKKDEVYPKSKVYTKDEIDSITGDIESLLEAI